MNNIYLVQKLPFENWETIAHFDNYAEADALCDKKIEAANNNPLLVSNYRVHVINDTLANRQRLGL
jgi:hypothetical protein